MIQNLVTHTTPLLTTIVVMVLTFTFGGMIGAIGISCIYINSYRRLMCYIRQLEEGKQRMHSRKVEIDHEK
jgi:hypothetical protein